MIHTPFTRKGRYVIYLGCLPEGYSPANAGDIPPGLSNLELLAPTTSPDFGQRLCRAYNRRQLEHGIPGRRWAIVSKRSTRAVS